ncbi:methionyl-tRNA formyltransferase [Hahella chejuensis KCTC 2396]|uniref:Methionyl-tRNA formyltransferase n=1 Tax=Hahella chejuensis (strain KCTC 2396) TaxID=349521 RepID=FMT_HAHCH|nr:methionyl-tRNA formyltransferase [Hahella chejuensis]Q2SQX2.1 RecName: Full=Methionyl-tRNA formyltransferase [Hahella chejuensis KCTC 2396]ABC26952.1 methionyl-tRNA formyltransferase [Hahella chejuensis KCTC 2396]
MSSPLKVIFAGTPDFAASALQALLDANYQIVAVYTQPDRPAGRGNKLLPGPVKQLALKHTIPVEQPLNFKNEEDRQQLRDYEADVMVVAAYGIILPQAVLDAPKRGCLNIHASLLPRWRGAAPIQRAIIAGDQESGITIMQMEAGLDTGPMLLKTVTPISADDTGRTLHDRLAQMGGEAIVKALALLQEDKLQAERQQDDLATYAHKLQKEEARIDWSEPASLIQRKIAAFNPWPVCFTEDNGQTIRIWAASASADMSKAKPGTILERSAEAVKVACGEGVLSITSLQLPGGKPISCKDLINGGKPLMQLGQVLEITS